MKTLIVGSKIVVEYDDLVNAIKYAPFQPTKIISTSNRWGDQLGERYARENNLPISYFNIPIYFPPNVEIVHQLYEMLSFIDALIILWAGMSIDTQMIARIAYEKKIKTSIWYVKALDHDEITPFIF